MLGRILDGQTLLALIEADVRDRLALGPVLMQLHLLDILNDHPLLPL